MRHPGHRWRVTIRLRLTLLYAGAFFIAGTVLIALMYLTLSQVINHQAASTGTLQHLSPDLGHVFRAESQRQRADILNTMLALRPEDRYPNAHATAEALRMYLAKRASIQTRRPQF